MFERLTLDGDTIVPPVVVAFTVLILFLSSRLMSLRLFPYQRTTDLAYKYAVVVDFVSWVFVKYIFANDKSFQSAIAMFFTPAGPFYLVAVFFPTQLMFLLSMCFRREVPFHAVAYSAFLLVLFAGAHTYFATQFGVNTRFVTDGSTKEPFPIGLGIEVPVSTRNTCDDQSYAALSLLVGSAIMISIAAFRSSRDRLNGFLLVWSAMGLISWANCAKNATDKGLSMLAAQVATYLILKMQRIFIRPGDGFKEKSTEQQQVAFYYNKVTAKDIKKVAIVLDGFIGPDAVICGISRSYEAWIYELINQGKEVLIYSAFSKESIEKYFGGKVKAFQLDALDIKYVQQIYYATRANVKNLRLVSQSFHDEKPDAVHVVFDGTSVPLFAWACAHLRIPIVGIMHTDSAVIAERNGFKLLAPVILTAQKLSGSCLESIATRSQSFADEMLRLRNWKCDHIIKPHVKTEVFKPLKGKEIDDIRKKFMFNDTDPNAILMIYAGRLDIDKRVDELIEIVKRVGDGIYLTVIGGGSLSDDFAELHGKENRVYCRPGFVSHEELAKFYSAADVHISASQMETLGNTVLEALACGTPVIVPRAQGFVDTVTHNQNGILWEANNLDDAVEKVKLLRDDPKVRKRLADGAVESIKELHCSKAVSDLIDWYVQAAEHRRANTMAVPRVFLSTFMLFNFFLFDFFILSHAKQVLEKFSDKKEREKNRQKHMKK